MNHNFRAATPDDLESLVRLHQLCYPLVGFSPAERAEVYTNNPRATWEDFWVVTDREQVVASMIAYRFNQYQEEAVLPVVGIGTVAVQPDNRREGVASFMLEQALHLFEEQGVPAAILYPFQHRFYRGFGWGVAGSLMQYHVATSQLTEYEDAFEDADLRVQLAGDNDLTQLRKFYEAQAKFSNGLLQRNERTWRERVLQPGRVLALARQSGDLIGYLIYSMKERQADNFFVQDLEVHEFFAPEQGAREALLGFIARQAEQAMGVVLSLPPDIPLHLLLEDPRSQNRRMFKRLYSEVGTLGLGWMARLVNLQSAFTSGRRFNDVQGELGLEMYDEALGDRQLVVQFNGLKTQVIEGEMPENCVSGSVDHISQLFYGAMSAEQAYSFDLLDFEGEATLEFCQEAFAISPPRCFDLF